MISGIGNLMDGIRSVSGSTDSNSNPNAAASTNDDLGENAFLKLLVAELSHQDPLNPMDNNQFITQMATFHSLEKLNSIEAILKRAYPEPTSDSTTGGDSTTATTNTTGNQP